MRIIRNGMLLRGQRGHRAIMVAAVAGLTATVLTASTSAGAALPPKPTTNHRIEATATDASATAPASFIAVTPVRILDTRPAPAGPVGLATPAKLGPGARLDLRLAGDGLIVPASASGVLINVTIDEDSTLPSYLTVWPLGEAQPFTSANNAYPGLIQSNSLVAKLGNGGISIFNQRGSVNVVIDLVGYIVPLASLDLPGSQLVSGAGAPTSATGDDGDFYLDTTNRILYGPKTNGTWPTPGITLGGGAGGPSGPAGATGATGPVGTTGPIGPIGTAGAVGAAGATGAAGSKVLAGTVTPTTEGTNGDFYVDTAAGSAFLKVGGVWVLQGTVGSLKGPQGIAGGAIAALGTFNNSPALLSSVISFDNVLNDVTVGTAISHDPVLTPTNFTLVTGTYRVTYRAALSIAALGSATTQLTLDQGVGQIAQGASNSVAGLALVSLGAVATDTVLVRVTAATGTLRLTIPSAVGLTLGSASIEIEKIA